MSRSVSQSICNCLALYLQVLLPAASCCFWSSSCSSCFAGGGISRGGIGLRPYIGMPTSMQSIGNGCEVFRHVLLVIDKYSVEHLNCYDRHVSCWLLLAGWHFRWFYHCDNVPRCTGTLIFVYNLFIFVSYIAFTSLLLDLLCHCVVVIICVCKVTFCTYANCIFVFIWREYLRYCSSCNLVLLTLACVNASPMMASDCRFS